MLFLCISLLGFSLGTREHLVINRNMIYMEKYCLKLTLVALLSTISNANGAEDYIDFFDRNETCKSGDFECKSGSVKCIPQAQVCDVVAQCDDRSDEHHCHRCGDQKDLFPCHQYRIKQYESQNNCIVLTWVCDGDLDCLDVSDGESCQGAWRFELKARGLKLNESNICEDDDFLCSSGQCIPKQWQCDKDADCSDESDEYDCPYSKMLSATSEG